MSDSYHIIQTVMALMIQGYNLPIDVFKDLLRYFISGNADDVEIAGFLKVFSQYPITSDYLIAAVDILHDHMISVPVGDNYQDAIDCCGTGGDGLNGLNVSTAVAFMVADYDIPVAKHGNRSVTSQSGSADVLEKLGYPIYQHPEYCAKQLQQTHLTFMFAPYFHPVLRHVALARKSLGIKTIFNLLGPLLNPAQVKRQLIGVYDFKLAKPIAETLLHFGCQKAMIVTSHENADELTLTADNHICILDHGHIHFDSLNARDVGLDNKPFSEIQGQDINYNTNALHTIFERTPSVYYDTVLLNAAACLWIANRASTIKEAVTLLQARKNVIDFQKYSVEI